MSATGGTGATSGGADGSGSTIRKTVMDAIIASIKSRESAILDLTSQDVGSGDSSDGDSKELSQEDSLTIQYDMNELNLIASTASSIIKGIHDTISAIIRNMA